MMMQRRIEDYALLGDLQTAVLVSREGSVDWACFPRFDSGACFAALLGAPEHGRWLLAPDEPAHETTRRYLPETLILETTHTTASGVVRVIDFMPPRGEAPDIVRIVEGVGGAVPMRSELIIRFDYGHIVPWVHQADDALLAAAGPDALAFRTPAETHGENLTTVSEVTVREGERVPFVLTWHPSHCPAPAAIDPEVALQDTVTYWAEWRDSRAPGPALDAAVQQSLLVLKSLTYAPTGGIVAAPTTSLPEEIGGVRNWDYRYCWLRDASLTLTAMLRAGYRSEAAAWEDWLLRAVAGSSADVQIMYGLAGERRLEERELAWLPGFLDSRPVRVGNAASHQLQLDVYGEVIDAAYQARRYGVNGNPSNWALLRSLLTWLEEGWREKDAGIWEVRGPVRHFTHSKVMAWVAFDRGVRMVEEFGFDGPVERWRAARDEIHAEVLERGWNAEVGAFTQSYGSRELDASVLQMPIVGFIPADDPRMVSTVAVIQRELDDGGLILRYRSEGRVDGLPAGEGVFLACSYWLVEVLSLQGRHDDACALFERLLALRNDLGLCSEEYDPAEGRMLGNFPQAFTHLALVEAAIALAERQPYRDMCARQP
ncbi:MAG: glycoside hydrolase family 15 protein [Thermomicrobiales bacterium]